MCAEQVDSLLLSSRSPAVVTPQTILEAVEDGRTACAMTGLRSCVYTGRQYPGIAGTTRGTTKHLATALALAVETCQPRRPIRHAARSPRHAGSRADAGNGATDATLQESCIVPGGAEVVAAGKGESGPVSLHNM